jgi:hypothetical protein
MTVTDVILNFRSALVAILPMVKALGIPWRRGDAYDEWDDLASCMYRQLVSNLLPTLDSPSGGSPVRLAAYDMMLPDYRQYATVEVQNSTLGHGRWIFHAFGTDSVPFDVVEVRELGSDAVPCSEEFRTCPLSGSQFLLRLPNGSIIDRVHVYSDPS